MKKLVAFLAPVILACGQMTTAPSTPTPSPSPSSQRKPNIVIIVADDLDMHAFQFMPFVHSLLVARGTSFSSCFVTSASCCPERVSVQTGQQTHGHEIFTIKYPTGGFRKYVESGKDQLSFFVASKRAGYKTFYAGKLLNQYSTYRQAYQPPGVDEWYIPLQENQYFKITFDANGRQELAPMEYEADSLGWYAQRFIRQTKGEPFLMFISPVGPHKPYQPAGRHYGMFSHKPFPMKPSHNEDILDKPNWLRRRQYPPFRMTAEGFAYLQRVYPRRLEALQALDEMVRDVVVEVEAAGQLDNTIVVFKSDNGLQLGEHQFLEGKDTPYEESIRVPLVIAGPGVVHQVREELVSVIDLTATIYDWTGATPMVEPDGRSLMPLLRGERVPWRSDVLIEHYDPLEEFGEAQTFHQLRTRKWSYVEYIDGERELYDMEADPYQLDNIFGIPSRDLPPEVTQLSARLNQLKTCRGASCR